MSAVGSFKHYRELLKESENLSNSGNEALSGNLLPFMGVILSDITFTEQANPDMTKDGQINWTKRTLVSLFLFILFIFILLIIISNPLKNK